jgi:hypothetical protein
MPIDLISTVEIKVTEPTPPGAPWKKGDEPVETDVGITGTHPSLIGTNGLVDVPDELRLLLRPDERGKRRTMIDIERDPPSTTWRRRSRRPRQVGPSGITS